MNNIDIAKVEVQVDISEVLNLISSKKSFEIGINGEVYPDNSSLKTTPIIYRSEDSSINSSVVDANTTIKTIFKNYKPQILGSKCLLKPLIAWQNVIGLNQERTLYFDHQSDGIELFEDKELEDIGWNASPLDVTYRQIAEFIEKNDEGTFVFYDNGIQFSGFVIVNDIIKTRENVKAFILNLVNEKMKSDELDLEDDDILESFEFFNIKI